jgi:predicted dehydrogenase
MSKDPYALNAGDAKTIAAPSLNYKPCNPKSYRPAIGLIGCGGITRHHLTAYKKAGYTVAALCDPNRENAVERAREFYPHAAVFNDASELLRRDEIEVVDIATHPNVRVALIEEALNARRHVLSQKPFVLDLDEGLRLADLADAKGVKLAVNQNGRWAPHFSWMREAVRTGLVGDVVGAHLSVHWDHNWIAGTPFDNIRHVILYDFAIHWFDMLTCFLGAREPKRVFATLAHSAGQKAKPPLLAQALVEYDGAQASLVFDADVKFGAQDRTYVAGRTGTLSSEGPDLSRQTLTYFNADGAAKPALEGAWFPDGFHGTMAELLCAIEEKREPSNGARENLRSLALAFAAIASAERKEPVIPGTVRKY